MVALTSTVLVAEIGEAPDIAEAHAEAHDRQDKLCIVGPRLSCPVLWLCLLGVGRAFLHVRCGVRRWLLHGDVEASARTCRTLILPKEKASLYQASVKPHIT